MFDFTFFSVHCVCWKVFNGWMWQLTPFSDSKFVFNYLYVAQQRCKFQSCLARSQGVCLRRNWFEKLTDPENITGVWQPSLVPPIAVLPQNWRLCQQLRFQISQFIILLSQNAQNHLQTQHQKKLIPRFFWLLYKHVSPHRFSDGLSKCYCYMILEHSDHLNLIKLIRYFLLATKGLCYAL